MCLHKLEKFSPCRVGYKVMRCNLDGTLRGEFYDTARPYPLDTWIEAKQYQGVKRQRLIKDKFYHVSYPTGFHVYHLKKDAVRGVGLSHSLRVVCVKVAVRKPVATGYQLHDTKVTVAKQIKILKVLAV